ncbi:hypothetical protein MJG53_018647 [Ovis ammon polii x Ovis aries]|uniref:Uncharacterized protein n=2 Tax=Ovis TaxID=9935 RepID=A0AAD4TQJ1_OVIAM|nr:hypothetical protein MG293_019453 [Ovis ammon polii]KAI4550867.1 hypothetical protein MJT46_018374 [Ovis ammon polii x Ovis aries]KAI4557894.1 hypothetical protein MJG53_018647 [Ovis ammon polii x Ovis aries]
MPDRVTWGGAGRSLGPPLTPEAVERLRSAGGVVERPPPMPRAAPSVCRKHSKKILAKLIMHMKAVFPELEIYDIMKPILSSQMQKQDIKILSRKSRNKGILNVEAGVIHDENERK